MRPFPSHIDIENRPLMLTIIVDNNDGIRRSVFSHTTETTATDVLVRMVNDNLIAKANGVTVASSSYLNADNINRICGLTCLACIMTKNK